jgi:hypothetical protein
MTRVLITLASALVLTAAPALAAPAPTLTADAGTAAGTSPGGNSSASATSAAKPARSEKTKYCVDVEQLTGSRLNMTQCKTRAEWAKEGVDVDELKKD